jgi:hypothetical protein
MDFHALTGHGPIQQFFSVEVSSVGDPGDLVCHGLVFVLHDLALGIIIGARGRLFRQLFHTDQLFVDYLQGAFSHLNHGNGITGIPDALVQNRNI